MSKARPCLLTPYTPGCAGQACAGVQQTGMLADNAVQTRGQMLGGLVSGFGAGSEKSLRSDPHSLLGEGSPVQLPQESDGSDSFCSRKSLNWVGNWGPKEGGTPWFAGQRAGCFLWPLLLPLPSHGVLARGKSADQEATLCSRSGWPAADGR